jgi:hypothetical protein
MPVDQFPGEVPDDLEEDLRATPENQRRLRFLRLWSNAVKQPGYIKKHWLEAEKRLRHADLLPQ